MKKIISTGFVIIIAFQVCFSQSNVLPNEKISVFTDRDLYITGEKIFISLFFTSDKNSNTSDSVNEIAYIELFNKKQKSVLKKKVKLIHKSAELYFMIPDNFDTGNYILLAYTKTQKYFCNNLSSGKIISIVNPNYVRFDSDTIVNHLKLIKKNTTSENGLDLSLNKNSYQTRDKVNLKISFSEKNKPEKFKYVLSVVRKGTIKDYQNKIRIKKDIETEKNPKFLKEKRISLTGIIIDKATGNPIEGKEIYLSGLKTEKQIHVVNSDSNGYFYFSLYNFIGVKDFYLATESEIPNSKIQIYNEFLNSCIPDEKIKLVLSTSEKELIEEMYLNQQLSDLKDSKTAYEILKTDTLISQFGKPDFKVYLKNFVKLPTLHEVFDEIIPSVRVREENKKYVLSIYDEELNLNYNNPLIILDNIPVFNVAEILKIKPSLINNIEIINKMYLSGSKIFNGIIILNSNSDKFCRIKLPENANFIKYQGFTNSVFPIFPVYNTNEKKESKNPDFRNTLYRETGDLTANANKIVSFYTSDYCADYIVNLYLINEKGIVFKNTKTFIVEK